MGPQKCRGPGPLIGEAEAVTLFSVAEENRAPPSYKASRRVTQSGAWQRLDSVVARIIRHMTREEGRIVVLWDGHSIDPEGTGLIVLHPDCATELGTELIGDGRTAQRILTGKPLTEQ